VASAILLITASMVIIKAGRDALFFQKNGLFDLPAAYIGTAALAFPLATVVLTLVRRFGLRKVRIGLPLVMALLLAGFSRLVHPGGGPLMTVFFLCVPLTFGVLFSVSWLLAAELLDGVPRRFLARQYSLIGAASIGGGVVGGALARTLATWLEPRALILAGALLLLAPAAVMAMAQRRFRQALPASDRPPMARGIDVVADAVGRPYILLLIGIAMLAAVSGIVIEFQFYLAAAGAGRDARSAAEFFSTFYLVLHLGALLVQLWAMPRLQRRIGVTGSLQVLPGVLVGGAAALLANASVLMRSGLKATEGGLKASIHRSNWEQAYLPIPAARRAPAKLLVDGLATRVGEGLAATAILVWLHGEAATGVAGRGIGWLTYALLGSVTLWLLLSRTLRHVVPRLVPEERLREECRPDIPLPDT